MIPFSPTSYTANATEGEVDVSIVCALYNEGRGVDLLLDKLQHEVLPRLGTTFELVLVDDGSKDETRAIIEKFYPSIRYIYQENAGLAVARNTGLAAALGEFIAFQDSDDNELSYRAAASSNKPLARWSPELYLLVVIKPLA